MPPSSMMDAEWGSEILPTAPAKKRDSFVTPWNSLNLRGLPHRAGDDPGPAPRFRSVAGLHHDAQHGLGAGGPQQDASAAVEVGVSRRHRTRDLLVGDGVGALADLHVY